MRETRDFAPLMLAAGILTPLVGMLAPKGLAPLFVALALGGGIAAWRGGFWRDAWHRPALLTAMVTAWSLLSALWAIDPVQSATTSLRLGVSCVGGFCLAALAARLPGDRPRGMTVAFTAALVLATIFILADFVWPNSASNLLFRLTHDGANMGAAFKSRLSRGGTVLSLLVWPLAVLVWRRFGRAAAAVLVGAVLATVLMGDSGSIKLAMLGATATFAAAGLAPRLFPRLLQGLLVLVLVLVPLAATQVPPPQETFRTWLWVPNSWHHRLTIWSFAANKAGEKPVLGWGMDASRDMPGGSDAVWVSRTEPDGRVIAFDEPLLPLHPHNAILQWWLELGAVGLALMGGWMCVLVGAVARLRATPWERAACLATFGAALVISVVSYGFWQYWWQGAMWIAAALCALAVGKGGRGAASTSNKEV